MDWGNYLFSFDGRINRAKYWLMVLISVLVMGVVIGILFGMGFAMVSFIIAGIIYLGLLYCAIAVGAKRLHDRNKSAWWLLVFYLVPNVLSGIGSASGSPGLNGILSLASFAILIWAIVELGCLRGTIGPNQYGPDPLEGRA
jgi:uncharacterized membrane protein YhaH (DUF805 family)